MAYPFPFASVVPKTPQQHPYLKDDILARSQSEASLMHASKHKASKRTTYVVLGAVLLLLWMINPFSAPNSQSDRVPFSNVVEDHFAHWEGHQDCDLASGALYVPPDLEVARDAKHNLFCRTRRTLLEAMSGGGRHGFDSPFFPAGCQYRWYSTPEICMILERFDALVFIGDDSLKAIYAAFNMLLRENIAMGGLKQWELSEKERESCRCGDQLSRSECVKAIVTDSDEVKANDAGSRHSSPYCCDTTSHQLLSIDSSPAPSTLHDKLATVFNANPDSYKPVPIIHSLSLASSLSWTQATASMDEWVALADNSGRNTPFLWVGPNAAGHLKPPGKILSEGNNALWHYTLETAKEAKARDLEVLGMYNLTLQAGSWDGSNYGEKVALVQAMMIVNWLSRVDST